MKFDRESHPIQIVQPYEVEFKKPNDLEKIGMIEVVRTFCSNYTGYQLLEDNILKECDCIRLKNPTVYQEILLTEFKVSFDGWIVGIGTDIREDKKYLLRIF